MEALRTDPPGSPAAAARARDRRSTGGPGASVGGELPDAPELEETARGSAVRGNYLHLAPGIVAGDLGHRIATTPGRRLGRYSPATRGSPLDRRVFEHAGCFITT